MHDMMVGMFWGGFVMAIPPVAVGVGIAVFLLREHARERAEKPPAP